MRLGLRLVCRIIVVVISLSIARAETPSASSNLGGIEIQVMDRTNAHVVSAQVYLSDQAKKEYKVDLARGYADYRASNLRAGSYSLKVDAPGFKSVSQMVNIVPGISKMRIDLEFASTSTLVDVGGPHHLVMIDGTRAEFPVFDLWRRSAPALDHVNPPTR